MTPKSYYVRLAISGTGQDIRRKIDIFAISNYLKQYAEIVAGEKWESWLEGLGLSTITGINEVVQGLKGVNIRSVKVWKN